MPEILFPTYRRYRDARVEANNAMAALLAGARLAGHTLSLTAGSTATLGELFPAVEHIHRFNMRSDHARALLTNADQHVASVAVPYALATHEAFIMQMLDFVRAEGLPLKGPQPARLKAWNMHAVLYETCGEPEPIEWIEQFHVLRQARNCITHAGAQVDDNLREAIDSMSTVAGESWKRLNRGATAAQLVGDDGQLTLTAEHIFTAFAVTKRLGREINALLGRALSGGTWASVAVQDYAEGTENIRNSSSWKRSLQGYVRQNYAAAPIGKHDLETAARQLELWTVDKW